MSTRQSKYVAVLDGVRVRVYATRTEYEVVFNDDGVDDMSARVLCYPKTGGTEPWAHQGRAGYKPETASSETVTP
jgi:hypothetical protein